MSRLPLGWFTARGSGSIKQLVQDDTLSLHYLVTHAIPDAVAAVIAPVAVLVYLFTVDWRLALVLFIPVLTYLVLMSVMTIQSGAKIGPGATLGRPDEWGGRSLSRRPARRPGVRRCRRFVEFPSPPR